MYSSDIPDSWDLLRAIPSQDVIVPSNTARKPAVVRRVAPRTVSESQALARTRRNGAPNYVRYIPSAEIHCHNGEALVGTSLASFGPSRALASAELGAAEQAKRTSTFDNSLLCGTGDEVKETEPGHKHVPSSSLTISPLDSAQASPEHAVLSCCLMPATIVSQAAAADHVDDIARMGGRSDSGSRTSSRNAISQEEPSLSHQEAHTAAIQPLTGQASGWLPCPQSVPTLSPCASEAGPRPTSSDDPTQAAEACSQTVVAAAPVCKAPDADMSEAEAEGPVPQALHAAAAAADNNGDHDPSQSTRPAFAPEPFLGPALSAAASAPEPAAGLRERRQEGESTQSEMETAALPPWSIEALKLRVRSRDPRLAYKEQQQCQQQRQQQQQQQSPDSLPLSADPAAPYQPAPHQSAASASAGGTAEINADGDISFSDLPVPDKPLNAAPGGVVTARPLVAATAPAPMGREAPFVLPPLQRGPATTSSRLLARLRPTTAMVYQAPVPVQRSAASKTGAGRGITKAAVAERRRRGRGIAELMSESGADPCEEQGGVRGGPAAAAAAAAASPAAFPVTDGDAAILEASVGGAGGVHGGGGPQGDRGTGQGGAVGLVRSAKRAVLPQVLPPPPPRGRFDFRTRRRRSHATEAPGAPPPLHCGVGGGAESPGHPHPGGDKPSAAGAAAYFKPEATKSEGLAPQAAPTTAGVPTSVPGPAHNRKRTTTQAGISDVGGSSAAAAATVAAVGTLQEALEEWRARRARGLRKTAESLLKNDLLARLAARCPTSVLCLEDVHGLPRPWVRQYGQEVLDVCRNHVHMRAAAAAAAAAAAVHTRCAADSGAGAAAIEVTVSEVERSADPGREVKQEEVSWWPTFVDGEGEVGGCPDAWLKGRPRFGMAPPAKRRMRAAAAAGASAAPPPAGASTTPPPRPEEGVEVLLGAQQPVAGAAVVAPPPPPPEPHRPSSSAAATGLEGGGDREGPRGEATSAAGGGDSKVRIRRHLLGILGLQDGLSLEEQLLADPPGFVAVEQPLSAPGFSASSEERRHRRLVPRASSGGGAPNPCEHDEALLYDDVGGGGAGGGVRPASRVASPPPEAPAPGQQAPPVAAYGTTSPVAANDGCGDGSAARAAAAAAGVKERQGGGVEAAQTGVGQKPKGGCGRRGRRSSRAEAVEVVKVKTKVKGTSGRRGKGRKVEAAAATAAATGWVPLPQGCRVRPAARLSYASTPAVHSIRVVDLLGVLAEAGRAAEPLLAAHEAEAKDGVLAGTGAEAVVASAAASSVYGHRQQDDPAQMAAAAAAADRTAVLPAAAVAAAAAAQTLGRLAAKDHVRRLRAMAAAALPAWEVRRVLACRVLAADTEAMAAAVLRVAPDAGRDEVRVAFRRLSLMVHPDKNRSVGAAEAFSLVSSSASMLLGKAW